jgi:hypothetical protein
MKKTLAALFMSLFLLFPTIARAGVGVNLDLQLGSPYAAPYYYAPYPGAYGYYPPPAYVYPYTYPYYYGPGYRYYRPHHRRPYRPYYRHPRYFHHRGR